MSKKWYLIGLLSSIVVLMIGAFVPALEEPATAVFLFGGIVMMAIALSINFGRGYWSKEGWSHMEQAPFNIPPNPRPRLGGFATGYATPMSLILVGGIVYIVLYVR
jgi:hypothetical protein